MAIEGSLKCIKFLMCVFNFIFLLLGITLLIIGIVITAQFSDYIEVIGNGFNVTPIIIILLGVIISIISFFGCYGAMRENRCMMNFFAICVIIILVVQVVCVILAFVKKGEAEQSVDGVLGGVVKNYLANPTYRDFMDVTQRALKCCGAHGYADYQFVFPNETRVPDSCCDSTKPSCDTHFTADKPLIVADFYIQGCRMQLINYLQTRIVVVAVVAMVVCFIEILAIIFACCMARNIDHYEMV